MHLSLYCCQNITLIPVMFVHLQPHCPHYRILFLNALLTMFCKSVLRFSCFGHLLPTILGFYIPHMSEMILYNYLSFRLTSFSMSHSSLIYIAANCMFYFSYSSVYFIVCMYTIVLLSSDPYLNQDL